MSAPWRLMPTASGRRKTAEASVAALSLHNRHRHCGLHCLWTLVQGLCLERPHRPPPVRPGSPAASTAPSVSTIGSGVWLPATVGIPVPGKAGGRETCRPPVGYRAAVCRRRPYPSSGLYLWSPVPGGYWFIPQCLPSPVLSTALRPSAHHRGTPVLAWGVRYFTLSFASRKFTFPFILGQVSYPILGNDFLAAHHLIVDPARRHVIHEPSHTVLSHPIPTSPTFPPSPFLSNLDSYPSSIRQLLSHYPTVFSTDLHSHPPKHGVCLFSLKPKALIPFASNKP